MIERSMITPEWDIGGGVKVETLKAEMPKSAPKGIIKRGGLRFESERRQGRVDAIIAGLILEGLCLLALRCR